MKFVAISDTHGCHRQLTNLPAGDVLIHGGDVCNRGNVDQVHDFLDWFAALDFDYKIFIAGNHDSVLATGESLIPSTFPDGSSFPDNMIHLVDQEFMVDGVKIWGAATKAKTGISKAANDWSSVPDDTDILITHFPPREILDQNFAGKHCGLKCLQECVKTLAPSVHLFGDVHASYGEQKIGLVQYYNASLYYAKTDSIVNVPFTFEL